MNRNKENIREKMIQGYQNQEELKQIYFSIIQETALQTETASWDYEKHLQTLDNQAD